MTFEQALALVQDAGVQKILNDDSLTDYQKAADIHAELNDPSIASKPRKTRSIKPKPAGDTDTATDLI